MQRRSTALIAIALALFVLACGGSSGGVAITPGAGAPAATAAPAPAAVIGKVGDRVEANGIALTVVKTEQKDELSQFQKAKDGNTYVVAEVLIENVSVDKARGTVAFEVKKTAKSLVMSYKPVVLFSGDEAIRVALN